MIEVTNEMVCALNENWPMGVARGEGMRLGLAAVIAIVERQQQEAYGEAYQRGWMRGQSQLCPRCSVELDREVAAAWQGETRVPVEGGAS